MVTGFFLSSSSFQRRLESRKTQPGCQKGTGVWQDHGTWGRDSLPLLSFPPAAASGNGLSKPLDSGLRRNDEVFVVTPVVI